LFSSLGSLLFDLLFDLLLYLFSLLVWKSFDFDGSSKR
jgi:hypothetical protein